MKFILIFLIIGMVDIMQAQNIRENLKRHVSALSNEIGERSGAANFAKLEKARDYVRKEFEKYGYKPILQTYESGHYKGIFTNLVAEKSGEKQKEKIILVGAHYDTAAGAPGADDNASGTAVLLELAGVLSKIKTDKTVRFVAFSNEEPPFFMTEDMGSWRHAHEAKEKKEQIEAMLCLESVGYFSDKPGSQKYPPFLNFIYPDKGNYISIVSNVPSRSLLKKTVKHFKKSASLPVQSLWAPQLLVPAISLSDQWAFWRHGYKAVMITDTAFLRTPYYHTSLDTHEKLDYERMAQVFQGIKGVILELSK
ncbi:MAG: M28 family peptidase [Elusimicrobia bacterium]|nr:M28 family peptidase [Elusimicrobiota bacterium]